MHINLSKGPKGRRTIPTIILIAVLMLSSASLACGLLPAFNTDEATPTAAPTEEPTEAPTEAAADEVTLTLINDLDEDVCYVHISPTSDDSWNDDWLGSSDILSAGDERTFTVDVSETTDWDMMASDCEQNALSTQYEISLTRDTTWQLSESLAAGPAVAGDTPFTITNDSSTDACWVYISPTPSDTWGQDWLGSDILYAGDSYTFYVDAGEWDLMVEDCDGAEMGTVSRIEVMDGEESIWSLSDTGFADPYSGASGGATGEATLWAINSSATDICWLYISPNTADSWGENWLGADILPAGSETMFTLSAGLYDLRAEDCNGDMLAERYSANIEGEVEWELYEEEADHPNGDGVGVTFVNETSEPVCYVWYGPPASEWEGDALGTEIIDGWGSLDVLLPPYTVVLQAEDCDGSIMKRTESFTPSNGAVWHIDP